jgi:16S rRNA C1402 (ribose-2'-O) methylase RsmI
MEGKLRETKLLLIWNKEGQISIGIREGLEGAEVVISEEIKKRKSILKRLKRNKNLIKNNSCRRDRELSLMKKRMLMYRSILSELNFAIKNCSI